MSKIVCEFVCSCDQSEENTRRFRVRREKVWAVTCLFVCVDTERDLGSEKQKKTNKSVEMF